MSDCRPDTAEATLRPPRNGAADEHAPCFRDGDGREDQSVAVNLANTQVFNVFKGKVGFQYWLAKNSVDEETYCNIYDLNPTALYLP